MTPDLQTLITPSEHREAIDRLEAAVDARLEVLVDGYEARWANLPDSVRVWLGEMLRFVVMDLRRELHAVVHDLLPLSKVH